MKLAKFNYNAKFVIISIYSKPLLNISSALYCIKDIGYELNLTAYIFIFCCLYSKGNYDFRLLYYGFYFLASPSKNVLSPSGWSINNHRTCIDTLMTFAIDKFLYLLVIPQHIFRQWYNVITNGSYQYVGLQMY